jgi:hypothetical protein
MCKQSRIPWCEVDGATHTSHVHYSPRRLIECRQAAVAGHTESDLVMYRSMTATVVCGDSDK